MKGFFLNVVSMLIVCHVKKGKQQEDPLGIVHDRDEAGTRHDREADGS